MSTSTSTSARSTGTRGTRRTTGRWRCHARASAMVSATGTPGTGSSPAGSCPARSATVKMRASRSPAATSPRTTRLTSCLLVSTASQVGHQGQWRHSVMRDGWASAGARSAAAVATAIRSATRSSYSANVDLPPGQCPDHRSCHTTTSASNPITPPQPPCGAARSGAHPAARSNRCRWASRRRSRGCDRTRRAGSTAAAAGHGRAGDDVTAPSPGSVIRCRTTTTGTYPPSGTRTSSSTGARRVPPARRASSAPQISAAPSATAAAVARSASASAGTTKHPVSRRMTAAMPARCRAASSRRCSTPDRAAPGGDHRIGIVVEVDAPTAAREIPGVERHSARPPYRAYSAGASFAVAVTGPRT